MTGHGEPSLRFADGPKTALDEMIDQLVVGADRVRRTQGRLRELLRACARVSSGLEVDTVLRDLAAAAAELTGAATAAVVVHGTDAVPSRTVGAGLSDCDLDLVLVGSSGPDGALHRSLTLDGSPYGELRLSDSDRGGFSTEDREFVEALVSTAETAISHARLYDASCRQERWLRASAQITQQILSAGGEDPLSVVAQVAAEVADADLVTLSLLTDDGGELVVEAGSGAHAEDFVGERFPIGGSLSEAALARGTALQVPDYRTALGHGRYGDSVIDSGPVMLVPLVGSSRTWGILTVIRTRGREAFSAEDLTTASDFANQATISLELAEARDAQQLIRVAEDRERIAMDLHDHVIQELFAIGIGLTNTAESAGVPDVVRRGVHRRVGELDRTIRRIRTSIFALRGTLDRSRDELRAASLDVASELTPVLGFSPDVQFSGAPGAVADDLVEDLTAVVREALTNVARHAHADSASVELVATTDRLRVVVTDDGVGIDHCQRRSGTTNLLTRAERRGGTCSVVPGAVRGTVLTWEVAM
ncbi:GAF domain-containing sensor histidine kinase [Nocardioides halotolerans]|uniref:GAF domain-containing sensor histidine kinase n=1 Tax=Nocardioides halotolerans TaxID=433660 RepID=UPI00041A0215|nr:GAF domain-containing protein [Nocardioides halotolerans]